MTKISSYPKGRIAYSVLSMLAVLTLFRMLYAERKNNWSDDIGNHRYGKDAADFHPTIYFLETFQYKSDLTLREVCSISSAAKHNPDSDIVLFHISPLITTSDGPNIAILKTIPNFRLVLLNPATIFADTPLESWFAHGGLNQSSHPVEHLSDALRLTLLYKHGGVYLDTDVIVLRPIAHLRNSVARETSNQNIVTAVLIFDQHHPFLRRCLEEFAAHFMPDVYAENGPLLFTRVYKKFCDGTPPSGEQCGQVTMLDNAAFYPFAWTQVKILYQSPSDSGFDMASSYAVHLFSRVSRHTTATPGNGTLIEFLVRDNCPLVYQRMLSIKTI